MNAGKWCAMSLIMAVALCHIGLASTKDDRSTVRKIEEIVEAEAKNDLFSGSVLFAKNGKILYSAAFGYANRDHMVPNTLDTRFNIGSIGKAFTAVLIMQLAQEGKLSLDDPLSIHLPEYPYEEKERILIRHLLNHTSGLGDYMQHEEYHSIQHELRKIDDVLPLIHDQEPLSEPGERFSYSNSGMILLGAVIEKITGMEYRACLKQRILDPLGMKDSGIVYPEETVLNRAVGYNNIYSDDYQVETLREPPGFSDGGLYTTAGDLLRFDQALYGEKLLSDEYKEIMHTPVEPSKNYAYGWIVVPFGGTTVLYHGGGCPGFNAEFRRYPEKGYTIIVLANYYGTPAFELANKIDSMLFEYPYALATRFDSNFRRGMYFQEGHKQYDKAALWFDKNVEGPKPHMPSLYQAARSRLLGEFEQERAIVALDKYIKLADKKTQPSIAAALWRMGMAFEQLGKKEQAVACYKDSLEKDPDFEQAKEALDKIGE
jgi:CubicO group peptidase (beta-lactamase class C family)